VVDKFIIQLEGQLEDRGVTVELTTEAREWLAKKGYDPRFGARPLARVIQENIKKPLAEELLFGKLAKGGTVRVGVEEGVLTFVFIEGPAKPAVSKEADEDTEQEPEEPALVD
jgi:ATP-dependent Clp protease ATP-binding subunit ClpA